MRRLATIKDIEQVFEIYMHESVVPYLTYEPMPLDDFRPIYDEMLQRGNFFVYEVNGQIAGMYGAWRHIARAAHVAYLGTLAVRPDLQGTGIAKEMVEDAIAKLRAEGVKRVELWIEADNARGIRFYKKLGFEIEGTLRKFYKRASDDYYVDEHIMALLFD